MKKTFSSNWKRSKQRRKQRKYRYNAEKHTLGKFLHASLSKVLREKYKKRSLRLRKGDKVKVLRGQFKGKEGKIDSVDLSLSKVNITGIESVKKDGTKSFYSIHASNLMITELNLDDKKRLKNPEKSTKEKQEGKEKKEENSQKKGKGSEK